MRIYFEDSSLTNCPKNAVLVSNCGYIEMVETLLDYKNRGFAIYTNNIAALNNSLCWNDDMNKCELYFRCDDGEWHLAQEICDKQINKIHNIQKMYMAGVFEYYYKRRKV